VAFFAIAQISCAPHNNGERDKPSDNKIGCFLKGGNKKGNAMKKIALSAAASLCAAVLFSGTAQAAEVETVSVAVSYADLDLTTETGQAALDSRINAAVKEVCAKPAVIRDLKAMTAWADCRKDAAASAFEQVGAADVATETFAVLF
jgi:UrcA family protein